MNKKDVSLLIVRYAFLVLIALPNLFLIYLVFTPLTVYPAFLAINSFHGATLYPGIETSACTQASDYFSVHYTSSLKGPVLTLLCPKNTIFFKGYFASIIPACVAGAAYYLLLILNLTTPMPPIKRLKSLLFTLIGFLILNVIRIVIFAEIIFKGYKYFDLAHVAVWYFGSTIMVLILWFVNVMIFKIKAIPFYSDVKNLFKDMTQSPQGDSL